jgi:Virulence-associated protein E/Bifunctional DNA primase/polymerase, N-terminal
MIFNEGVKTELKELYDAGFALHWLVSRSKRPVESGWTSGKRKEWDAFLDGYVKGQNVGVRLGRASRIGEYNLAVIDCDVKSEVPAHLAEMERRLSEILESEAIRSAPVGWSGRGNGSRHVYLLTPSQVNTRRLSQSAEKVKVLMPSVKPSANDRAVLTVGEIEAGYRSRPAWELLLMGEGAQVVLPPSIHPDTGAAYRWDRPFDAGALSLFKDLNAPAYRDSAADVGTILEDFEAVVVNLESAGLSGAIIDAIVDGEGVEDRSASLLGVCNAMLRVGLSDREILSVLTNPKYYLGRVAYEHTASTSRVRAAEWIRKYTLEKSKRSTLAEEAFRAEVTVTETLSEAKAKEQAFELVGAVVRPLEDRLEYNKQGVLKANFPNVLKIIQEADRGRVFLRDEFAFRDSYGEDTAWGGRRGEAIADVDAIRIKEWLTETYGIAPSRQIVGEVINLLCVKNGFHPVRDYVDSLTWDGVERIPGWLKTYLKAEGPEPYLSEVGEKFLLAMIARVYSPGVKFDHTVVLEGNQGIGKSSAGRILAGDAWFLDSLPDLRDKDAALNLQGTWVVEISELASLRNHEAEIYKSFLTRTTDKVRPPYGERRVELPRQCVFLGTTNSDNYLKDRTGNRRFWPVVVRGCAFRKLERDRDQLLAEARWVWDNLAPSLYLEGAEAKEQATEAQRDRIAEDESAVMADRMIDFLNEQKRLPDGERFDVSRIKLRSLFNSETVPPGPLHKWREDQRHFNFAGQALKSVGYEKYKSNGENFWRPKRDIEGDAKNMGLPRQKVFIR